MSSRPGSRASSTERNPATQRRRPDSPNTNSATSAGGELSPSNPQPDKRASMEESMEEYKQKVNSSLSRATYVDHESGAVLLQKFNLLINTLGHGSKMWPLLTVEKQVESFQKLTDGYIEIMGKIDDPSQWKKPVDPTLKMAETMAANSKETLDKALLGDQT